MKDYHSLDGRTVKEDKSQDVELVYGEEIEGTTVLRYKVYNYLQLLYTEVYFSEKVVVHNFIVFFEMKMS